MLCSCYAVGSEVLQQRQVDDTAQGEITTRTDPHRRPCPATIHGNGSFELRRLRITNRNHGKGRRSCHQTARERTRAPPWHTRPGVAYPCLEIAERPEDAYRYTAKGNLVAVISNGTAVLGLGNIGALASKPVMEGKGLLLKTFADIDVFDIEVDTEDPETFIRTVVSISKTFGGINLEDIKALNASRSSVESPRRRTFP